MRIIIRSVFVLSITLRLFIFSSPALADFDQQRQIFLDAEKALQSHRMQEYRQLLPQLKDYPLYPYLVYEEIRKDISLQHEEKILGFLREYHSSPLADRLRQAWLQYLTDSSQWQRLIRDYRTTSSQAVQCAYARALGETGKSGDALKEAEKLWLHGRSMPKECDPVFNEWRKRGALTTELVWQRIELAIEQGQTGLAGYLGRYLPKEDQLWLDLWLEVISRPARTLGINWSKQKHPVAEKILVQGMGRLIREDTQKALQQWKELEKKHNLKSLDTAPVQQELALYLALRKHPEALDFINSLSADIMTPRLREWHARKALYLGDWQEALSAIEKMDDLQKGSPRWTYWRGRALEQMGEVHESTALYQSILGRQNYFSLLAADRLNQPYRIEHRAISAIGSDILKVRSDPGIMRAMELYYLERMIDARREWSASLSGKTTGEIRASALLAHDMGWHDRAIVSAANAREFDDLVLRFPTSYSDLISDYSRSRGLDPSWVFALARQESMFMADVGSPAGALGVMQIMPSTGRLIASMKGERLQSRFILLSPETNIRFGTFYLKKRLDELQSSPVLATAAYNAGAHRVRAWLPQKGTMEADIWVENIPFFETRDYIEKVFTYRVIYEKHLGILPVRVASLMPDVLGHSLAAARVE